MIDEEFGLRITDVVSVAQRLEQVDPAAQQPAAAPAAPAEESSPEA